MLTQEELKALCSVYGICAGEIGAVIDSSRSEEDKRYNYSIDKKYMLKINNARPVTEEFLTQISRLQDRYRKIGIYCPLLIRNQYGKFGYPFRHEGENYLCFAEEYAVYEIADPEKVDEFKLKKKMLGHLGKLASAYTGIDLVETRSMWSIIDLAPLDEKVDEKQENLDDLTACLREKGYGKLAPQLQEANQAARAVILEHFSELPRCVYQGDLNLSNLLVDEKGEFAGIIDFNMFGTEVNINCFLNETMWGGEKAVFEEKSAAEILREMQEKQKELLEGIWKYYTPNEVEKKCIPAYQKVIYLSLYPNVVLWKHLLQTQQHTEKVLELLRLILAV